MNKVFIFSLGAVVGGTAGALITWKLVEQKYKKMADEDIESVREYYREKEEKMGNPYAEEHFKVDELEEEKNEYNKQITDLGYADDDATVILNPTEDIIAPYVISPDEFGDTQYYDIKSLVYYKDDVLADDDGEIMVDPENIIGDALAHFGEFEDDAVHVRNEHTECDYEILRNEKTYSEVYGEDI